MKALLDMEATVPKDKELALECQVRHRISNLIVYRSR